MVEVSPDIKEVSERPERLSVFSWFWKWRRYLILVCTPLLLLPLPILVPGKQFRCAYAVLLMGVYWVTEVCPLAVTGFLPIVLFPILGVLKSDEATKPYFKDTNALFLGGLVVAVAIEHVKLHKRIALRVLLLVGAQPRRLMLGFMLTTALLSMWISNTATTAMMIPIVQAVLGELKQDQLKRDRGDPDQELNENETERKLMGTKSDIELDVVETGTGEISQSQMNLTADNSQNTAEENDKFVKMNKCLILAVAYAANVGGTGTLMGTGPNLVMNGLAETLFPNGPGIGFAYWSMFVFPITFILVICAWVLLQFIWLGISFKHLMCCCRLCKKDNSTSKRQGEVVKKVIQDQYKGLGPMRFEEKVVLFHFIFLVLLWLLRDPKFIPGWAYFFPKGYVKDAQSAMFVAFLLFVMPANRPKSSDPGPPKTILSWEVMTHKFPWGLLILMGSGFSLAEGCKESGLSSWVGEQMKGLDAIPPWAIVLVCCILITMFTEFTSNTATATIFLPILAELAVNLNVHPWYMMMPCTISASFAFMLPVATPPNAIVFASGEVRIPDMVKSGIWMNLLCVVVLVTLVNTYDRWILDLDTFPDWAKIPSSMGGNVTLVCKNVTQSL